MKKSQNGIALVMVLGVLSVMLLLAVAFAISMRTERVAAGNYADSVRARHLTHTALAHALDRLAGELGTNGLLGASGGSNYPPFTVLCSESPIYINPSTNPISLCLLHNPTLDDVPNEFTNFVPRVFWDLATNMDQAAGSGADRHWVCENFDNDGTEEALGRFKYLIIDCSGLLDANFVGNAGAVRGTGTNPTEMVLANMSELNSVNFFNNRSSHARYETQEELAKLNASGFHGQPTNFTVFSHALPGYWDFTGSFIGTQVNLAGNSVQLSEPERKDAIMNGFLLAGLGNINEAGILYSNLIEYVDDDLVPSNLIHCVEAVPMINEVIVEVNVQVADGTPPPASAKKYTLNGTVRIECWYPFAKPVAEAFVLRSAVGFAEPNNIKPANLAISEDSLGTPAAGPFKTITRTFGPTEINKENIYNMELASVFTLLEVCRAADLSVACDKVNNMAFTNSHNGITSSNTFSGAECLDPRFNLNAADPAHWRPTAAASIDAINPWALAESALPANDGDTAMFVANRPLLSVGELGYLAYAPWKTIKLYGADLHRVFDVFAIGTNQADVFVTNIVWRGRVNPNTTESAVLGVVFDNMPLDEYPEQGAAALAPAAIQGITNNIHVNRPYINFSDICRNFISANLPGDNELKREAVFRNSFGLLNLRQNLFAILIEAHVASGGNFPRHPIKQRAVALVWRDPFTGEMFIRSLKWLQD